jgi:hypothetical protein
LQETSLLSTNSQPASVHFWTNSETADAKQVIAWLWGKDTDVAVLDGI